jgi:hydroxymethylbilane synthase
MSQSPTSNLQPPTSVVRRSSSIALQRRIVIGTRGSALAQWQTQHIVREIMRLAPDLQVEVRVIKTSGDKDQTRALADLGGLGVFTKEIENALLAHEIDLAVHSLKDLPTDIAEGLVIAAIPAREDARDCLVSRHAVGLMQLPPGARVGTSSARRTAQLLALRPDLQIVPLRGNVDTRLRKAQSEDYDAVVLAAAGLVRLGRAGEITEYLPFDWMLPDPGQGALAVEIRSDDSSLAELLAPLNHAATRAAVLAERAFLRALGGGCRMPMGACAETRDGVGAIDQSSLQIRGMVGALDGRRIVHGEIEGDPARAEELGAALAERLLREGAAEILGIPMGAIFQSPLQGMRILITRAAGQADALADKLRALGGEPIEFPTIDFAPLDDYGELDAALARVPEFDWVVFTSANGVHAVAERLNTLGLLPSIFALRQIAAIGPATARALVQLGLRVDFIPTKFLGEQIALELPVESGQRALLLRADIASAVLAKGLTARGVAVTDVDAYRTVRPPVREVDLTRVDAIMFTSSSTVRNFMAMLASRAIGGAAVFCIGPVTAETARELGLRVAAVASEHTVDGLVRAMVEFYQSSDDSRR